jgi:hypothetical protein
MKPSLDFPPVYRRMLSGGPARLRLSRLHFGLLLTSGVAIAAILAVRCLAGADETAGLSVATALAATLAALLTGAIAARWLGSGTATLAGMVYLGGAALLSDAINGPFSVTALTAIGSCALATVPGRLPVDSRWVVGLVFYVALGTAVAIAGPGGASSILVTCVATVFVSQNMRALRFFLHPWGIAFLVLATAAWWTARHAGMTISFNGYSTSMIEKLAIRPGRWQAPVLVWMAMLSCILFAVVALIAGLRQGHLATPFWRFVGCWIVTPLCLATLEMLVPSTAMAIFLPPLAIIAASGAAACWVARHRVLRRRLLRPRTPIDG